MGGFSDIKEGREVKKFIFFRNEVGGKGNYLGGFSLVCERGRSFFFVFLILEYENEDCVEIKGGY